MNLAARCDLDGTSISDYDTNSRGVEIVLDAVRDTPSIQRFIQASSRYVHRTEVFPKHDEDYSAFTCYGESKILTERIVRTRNLEIPWILVRPTSIWGPWFRIPYRTFFDTVRRGVYIHPMGASIRKSYGYVGNVVHQLRAFLNVDAALVNKKTFYVSDDSNIDVLEFAHSIRNAFNAPPVHQAPMFLLKSIATAGDLLKKAGMNNPPLTNFRLNNLLAQMNYDMSATVAVAQPSPFSLQQGVERTVEWIKRHG